MDLEKYIDKGMDQENIIPLRRGWKVNGGKSKCGNKNTAAYLEWRPASLLDKCWIINPKI